MSGKKWLLLLVIQISVAVAVVGIFRGIADRRLAGLVAAGLFFTSAGVMAVILWRSSQAWRSLTTYALLVHMFFSSLPMVVIRLIHYDKDFTQIMIFGMPGPVFHYWAQKIYLAMMLATVVDLCIHLWNKKRSVANKA